MPNSDTQKAVRSMPESEVYQHAHEHRHVDGRVHSHDHGHPYTLTMTEHSGSDHVHDHVAMPSPVKSRQKRHFGVELDAWGNCIGRVEIKDADVRPITLPTGGIPTPPAIAYALYVGGKLFRECTAFEVTEEGGDGEF